MFATLRSRLIAISVSIVVLALLAVACANFSITRSRTLESIHIRMQQLARSQADGIAEWGSARRAVVASARLAAVSPEPALLLKAAALAGGFDNHYHILRRCRQRQAGGDVCGTGASARWCQRGAGG